MGYRRRLFICRKMWGCVQTLALLVHSLMRAFFQSKEIKCNIYLSYRKKERGWLYKTCVLNRITHYRSTKTKKNNITDANGNKIEKKSWVEWVVVSNARRVASFLTLETWRPQGVTERENPTEKCTFFAVVHYRTSHTILSNITDFFLLSLFYFMLLCHSSM